jgi:Bacterial SH3 domain
MLVLLLCGAGAVYYRGVWAPAHTVHGPAAYVVPRSLDVMDTTAQIRSKVGQLKAGDRVEVLAQTAHWSELRLPRGRTGWVETKYLLDGATYGRGQAVLRSLNQETVQAEGHTSTATNLHLEPARDSLSLGELAQNEQLDIFARRLVERAPDAQAPAKAAVRHDVWYLVRSRNSAGWVLGRFIDLDIPPGIAVYAQGINMVAWLALKTVQDGGRAVPEYLVADRIGAEDVDFNHIRVFTWWLKNHKYVTAYVESGLSGHFPITASQLTDTDYFAQRSPYFRLRLTDDEGHQYQKVYGMFDTIVHAVGTVDGWTSGAIPPREKRQARKGQPEPVQRAHKRRR